MSSNDQAIEKIWWQLCLNSTSLYRSALGPITKSEMISLGRRSIASSEVTSSVISSQKSAEDILDDTHTLIDAINKNGNFFKIIEISKNDKLGGLIFVHPHHQQLAESGHIAEVENTPLSNYRIKYPARSTIILTLDMLKTIEDPENLGTPAFPALETYFSEYDEELLSDVYYDFPDLLPRGESKIAEIYRRSAKHMFTHGRRAEILWGFLADRIGPSDKYFRSISPSITMANGTDGGIDDLRTTATGALLATQVKGGKTWGETSDPRKDARKFFVLDGESQHQWKHRRTRIKLYPMLDEPVGNEGAIRDDHLIVHFLAFGKRSPGSVKVLRGKTWPSHRNRSGQPPRGKGEVAPLPIDRRMYISGMDVIVLSNAEFFGKTRVDMSHSSTSLLSKITNKPLTHPLALDYDVPFKPVSPI